MASPTWYRFTDAAGTNVFMNYESGEISMTMPLEFFSPGFSGWIPCSDSTGSTWWGSVYTGEVSWEPPVKGLSLPHTPREQGEDPQQGTARSITPPSVPWSLSPTRLRRERSPNPPRTQQLPRPYTPHHSPSQQPLDRHLLPRSVSPHPPPAIGTPRLTAGVFPIRSTSPPPSQEVDSSTTGRGPQLSFPTQPPRLGTLHHFTMPSPPAFHIVAAPPPPQVLQHPAVRPRSRSPPMLTASSRVYLQQQQQQQQVLQHQQHHPVRPRSRSPPQLSASSHDQHLQQHHQQQRQQPSPASVYLRGRVRAPSPPIPSAFSSSRPRFRSPQPHASFSFTHPPTSSSSSSLAPSAKLPLLSQGSPPQRQPWQQNDGGGGMQPISGGLGEVFDRLPTSPPPSHLHHRPRSTSPFSSGIPVAQRPPSPFAGDGFRSALHASVSPVGEALASLQAREAIKYLQSAPGSGWGGGGVGGKKSSVSGSSSSSASEKSGIQGTRVGASEQRSSPRSKSTAATKPLSTVLYSYVQDLSEMHVAAIVIQAVFRGYIARKRHEGWIAKWRRY